MKKLLVFVFAIGVLASCQKEEAVEATSQDVVFSGIDSGSAKKSTDADPCGNALADYAKVTIDGDVYRPAVFYIDDVAFTQALKLEPGNYVIDEFMLINDNGTPNDTDDDYIVKAAPLAGAEFAEFVNTPLAFSFDVEGFKKAEVNVEVLCFEEKDYESFGFSWFAMTGITVREQVFFGDFCAKHPAEYVGSLYDQQANGVQLDMPAIFRIDVYKNETFIKSYDNTAWFGEGEPLKVQYPDHDNAEDAFAFELFILVKSGTEFVYKSFHTWEFNDAEMIESGDEGVVDFVLGNCNADEADLVLAPYMNLPETMTYKIVKVPGDLGGFFDTEISGVGDGYDIWNGVWPTFCADNETIINVGTSYTMDVYSSLYPASFPEHVKEVVSVNNLDRVNWLMNNLDNYPDRTWEDVQAFIWTEVNGWNGSYEGYVGTLANHPTTTQMMTDAAAYGEGYVPLPGGWAAVLLTSGASVQLQLVVVDP